MESLTRNPEDEHLELLLACLENETAPNSLCSDEQTLSKTLELAQHNGVLYAFVARLDESVTLPAEYRSEWEAERTRIQRLHRTVKALKAASSAGDIEFILIKDCNTVPHSPRDVDIFVRGTDKAEMIECLRAEGMTVEHNGSIETSLTGRRYLPVDIYTGVVYFDHEFFDESVLFAATERRTANGMSYPGLDDETEFLLTLVHGVFGHRRFTLLDFLHLDRLWQSSLSLDRCREITSDHGWEATFEQFLELFRGLRRAVYESEETVSFPVLLARADVMACIRSLRQRPLDRTEELAITLSLVIDGLKVRVENSWLHEPLRQCTPVREALLSVAYLSRRFRGDKYS